MVRQGHPHVPKCPLCMVGHITTSINTIMNRLTAQHHVGPPPEAPRGASKAVLGSVADTLFVSKNRSQHGTLVLIQKTPRIWTSKARFQNGLRPDPPPQESTGCWRFRRRAGVGAGEPLYEHCAMYMYTITSVPFTRIKRTQAKGYGFYGVQVHSTVLMCSGSPVRLCIN